MKFSELKRIAKENDYEFRESLEYKSISLTRRISVDGFINNLITINSNTKNQIFIENVHCDEKDLKMIKASIEFAETPPEDREVEKKFYLRHRWLECNEADYLNFEISGNYYGLNSKRDVSWAKTKFTLKEIEKIKAKFDTDLKDFELVEVEE